MFVSSHLFNWVNLVRHSSDFLKCWPKVLNSMGNLWYSQQELLQLNQYFICKILISASYNIRILTSIQLLILFVILTSTSTVSPTFSAGGSAKSSWIGRKTLMVFGVEKRRPRLDKERAQSDQRPASDGAEMVTPSVDSWFLDGFKLFIIIWAWSEMS